MEPGGKSVTVPYGTRMLRMAGAMQSDFISLTDTARRKVTRHRLGQHQISLARISHSASAMRVAAGCWSTKRAAERDVRGA